MKLDYLALNFDTLEEYRKNMTTWKTSHIKQLYKVYDNNFKYYKYIVAYNSSTKYKYTHFFVRGELYETPDGKNEVVDSSLITVYPLSERTYRKYLVKLVDAGVAKILW